MRNAILIVSDDLHWIKKVTKRALVLDEGKIQLDQPLSQLFQQESILEYYGLPLNW